MNNLDTHHLSLLENNRHQDRKRNEPSHIINIRNMGTTFLL